MNVLTLRPGLRAFHYAYFLEGLNEPILHGRSTEFLGTRTYEQEILAFLNQIKGICAARTPGQGPDAVAIRGVYGGNIFTRPVLATSEVLESLLSVIPCAPLHVPVLVDLAKGCLGVFEEALTILVFETAFFTGLPLREQLCGLDAKTTERFCFERLGYHGIFHQAARDFFAHAHFRNGRCEPLRLLSVCLEPQPEVTAILDDAPLMVTSGVSPLEGIPGETSCGELDPGIVLALIRKASIGPEEINAMLTQESGLKGLVGRGVSLEEVLSSNTADVETAREVLEYRVTQACGAGVAAMGGLDAIVFSGRYANAGELLGPRLLQRLLGALSTDDRGIEIYVLNESLDRLLADTAIAVSWKLKRLSRVGEEGWEDGDETSSAQAQIGSNEVC